MTCTFTIDNIVNSVTHDGNPLVIDGALEAYQFMKTVHFNCTNEDPGFLVISGTDENEFEDPNQHCTWAGLVLHCEADDTSNPWHDFVSNDIDWVDENNETPCATTSGGFLNANLSFVQDMLSFGAKKIWAERKNVILTGTPPI